MTVMELISLNQNIVDLVIEVRDYPDSGKLLEAIHIGPSAGVEPPYPTMIGPQNNPSLLHKAIYKRTNINAWDDGRDYWQTKVNRIPKQFLNLEVFSWRRDEAHRNMRYHSREDMTYSAECYLINTYKPEYIGLLEYVEDKAPKLEQKQLEGQLCIEDILEDKRW